MPRILIHLATPGGMTGAPKRTLHLCESLRSRGVEVGIIGSPGDEFYADAARRGFDTLPLPLPELLSRKHKVLLRGFPWMQIRAAVAIVRMTVRLVKLIRSWGPDVLWTRGAKGIAFMALAAVVTRRPLIWDVAMEPVRSRIVTLLHRVGLTLSDAIVVQYAGAVKRLFGTGAAAKYGRKFHALIPSINLEPLQGQTGSPVRHDRFILLEVGTVCDRKNQEFAIECLAELRQGGTDAELWLAGAIYDPAYADRVREVAASLGVAAHVQFLGWRDDVRALLLQSTVFILPSLDEGVSNAVQEAMALGVPVVVSEAGGQPEILENGVTGWSLPLDRDVWVRVLRTLAESEETRRRVGDAAARYAVATFGESAWPDRYAALIHTIAKGKK